MYNRQKDIHSKSASSQSSPLESRQTLKFLRQVEEAADEVKGYLEKRVLLGYDGLEQVRERLESLGRTIAQVKPQILAYEENRKPLNISLDYYDERNAAQAMLDKAKKELKKAQPSYERKKQQYTDQIEKINTQLNDNRWKDILKKGEYIESQNTKLNDLNRTRITMEKQRDALERKIQGKCCHASKNVAKKEKIELARVEGVLKDLHAEVEVVFQKYEQAKHKNDRLKEKRDALIAKRDLVKKSKADLIDSFPKELEQAESGVVSARKELARLDAERKTLQKQYLRNVDREVMFDLIHLYAKFLHIKEVLFEAYGKETKAHALESEKDYRQKMENIDTANGLLAQHEKILFGYLKHLHCEQAENARGSELYMNVAKLPPKKKEYFVESDYSPNELMDALLPVARLEVASTIVDDIAASRMSSMHLFFNSASVSQAIAPEKDIVQEEMAKKIA